MALPVNFVDLTLGCTLALPHIDGEVLDIKVPKGSMPGETVTIKGRGFSNNRRSGRGDVTVVLRLKPVGKISRKTKKVLEELRGMIEDGKDAEESALDEARRRRR